MVLSALSSADSSIGLLNRGSPVRIGEGVLTHDLKDLTLKCEMYDKEINPQLDKTLGYMYFCDMDHPLANKSGKVYYHRHIASNKDRSMAKR